MVYAISLCKGTHIHPATLHHRNVHHVSGYYVPARGVNRHQRQRNGQIILISPLVSFTLLTDIVEPNMIYADQESEDHLPLHDAPQPLQTFYLHGLSLWTVGIG